MYRINYTSYTEQFIGLPGTNVRVRELGSGDNDWYQMDFAGEGERAQRGRNRIIELVRGALTTDPQVMPTPDPVEGAVSVPFTLRLLETRQPTRPFLGSRAVISNTSISIDANPYTLTVPFSTREPQFFDSNRYAAYLYIPDNLIIITSSRGAFIRDSTYDDTPSNTSGLDAWRTSANDIQDESWDTVITFASKV